MKARVLSETPVYAEMDASSQVAHRLPADAEVVLGATHKLDETDWVEVTGPNEESGYLPGDTQVFVIQRAVVGDKLADLYSEPANKGIITEILARGTKLDILAILDLPDGRWVKIRGIDGKEGYLSGKTRIRLDRRSGPGGSGVPGPGDVVKQLRSWGIGLIIMGALSLAISQYLNQAWGIALLALGIVTLLVRKRVMFLAIGASLMVAGILNLLVSGLGGWALFAALQIIWGIQVMRSYWRYGREGAA